MKNKEEKQLVKLMKERKPLNYYVLDNTNAIAVFKKDSNYMGEFIHYRLNNNELIEVKKFESSILFNNYISVIPGTTDLVRICQIGVNAIYNYKTAQFIVPEGIWSSIHYDDWILNTNKGILVTLDIESELVSYSYDNKIYNVMYNSDQKQCFSVKEHYYAIINLDGSIRSNKLFKGDHFWEITEAIDLNNYPSLNDFILKRKQVCNEQAEAQKNEFIKGINNNFLDKEVVQILNLSKKPTNNVNVLIL